MKNGPGGSTWLTDELFDLLVEMQGASHFAACIAAVKLACLKSVFVCLEQAFCSIGTIFCEA
jgi:hypothetical protein